MSAVSDLFKSTSSLSEEEGAALLARSSRVSRASTRKAWSGRPAGRRLNGLALAARAVKC
jgi:hypothetical protein